MTFSRFPACYVQLPTETNGSRAPFYLAAEEYIAQRLPADNYLFSWQVSPTVVIGRNQSAEAELDLAFCRRKGIDIVRRKSGGGAIFADRNNIMWSLVTGQSAVEPLFAEYAESVAIALRSLGVPARVSGRNDIRIDEGGKICGNAFYHLSSRNIVHGTMLYDTDPELMEGALSPDKTKLQAKGVKSVRSRVALLKDFLNIGITDLRNKLRSFLCDRSVLLDAEAVREIREIERTYYATDYLFGKQSHNHHTTFHASRRFDGCGMIDLGLSMYEGLITDLALIGDFFELQDASAAFRSILIGKPLDPCVLTEAIRDFRPENVIRGLKRENLLSLLTEIEALNNEQASQ